MKKVIPLSLICLLLVGIGQVRAQTAEQPLGFKIGFGLNGYQGDLGNTMLQYASDMGAPPCPPKTRHGASTLSIEMQRQ